MIKEKIKIYLCFIILNILISFNLISQDTLKLNLVAQGYITKILGSKYFKLKYEPITEIKSLESFNKTKFRHATITEINNDALNIQVVFKPIYILIVEYDDEFIVYESYSKIDFKYAKQIFKSDYSKEFVDLTIKVITDEFNFFDITMNFHDEKENANIDTLSRIFIMYYKNTSKYSLYEYEKNMFVSIGLEDFNFDGKIELNKDYFFCDRHNAKYFYTSFNNKMCNYLSKNNYIIVDSLHIYKLSLLQNKTDVVILEKVDRVQTSFYDKTISLFNKAPMQIMYDSINNLNLRIGDLFTNNKYVYIDIATASCPPCIRNLPKLDALSKLYNKDLIILSLLDKDTDKSELPGIIKTHKVQHSFGWSNKIINHELLLFGYPNGVLFDKTGSLIDFYNLEELNNFCKENFK